MIAVNSILEINGEQIVPVRAIPFVTGGHMPPRCLASVLASPEYRLSTWVRDSNGAVTQLLPKSWKQFKDQLELIASGANNLDLIARNTLEILPASTFVEWKTFWRTYEEIFLPPREDIHLYPLAERVDYGLQEVALIPTPLVDLVFEGFTSQTKVKPIPRASAQDQEVIATIAALGFDPKGLPKDDPGKPGVKAKVREAVGKNGMWAGTTVFNKAWDRLLKSGDIARKP